MNKKRDYYNDIRLIKSRGGALFTTVSIISLFLFPLFAGTYLVYVATLILIYSIVAIGLNLLVGFTGQISLGHSGFMAMGAYISVLTMLHLKLPFNINPPFIVVVVVSGLIAAFIGFVIGLIALKTKGPYLAIVTLGFGIFVEQGLVLAESITGGRSGISSPPISILGHSVIERVTILGAEFSNREQVYFIILTITLLLTLFAFKIIKSKIGRAFVAIGDSEVAASASGINLTYYRTLAFAISAFYVGIAGALHANMMDWISPSQYGIMTNIDMIAMIVVGGLGSIFGSVLGATLLTILPQLFSKYNFMSTIIVGTIMIIIVIFQPRGLSGMLSTLLNTRGNRIGRLLKAATNRK